MRKKLLYLIIIFVFQFQLNAQDSLYIKPSITDALIDGRDSLHYVAINRIVNDQNKLVLFFPGTGALTSEYTKFLNTAANLGLHTIGLSYENEISPEFLCLTTTDTTCFDRARNEIIFGWNQHAVIDVDGNNSIYYRTVKLLKYLDAAYPADNWGQFLDSQDSIIWSKVRVAGHSQGGNHAGFISKLYSVDRCIIFSSRDWMAFYQEPAKWVQRPGLTDSTAYFGFVHALDTNAYGLNSEILINWSYFNMDGFGSIVCIDTLSSPFLGRHMLTSNLPQPQGNTVHHYFHRTVIGNDDTPLVSVNTPVYKPVWEYMLGGSETLSITSSLIRNVDFIIFPNPSNTQINILSSHLNKIYSYAILSYNGTIHLQGVSSGNIDVSHLQSGIYFLKIESDKGTAVQKFIKQ
jgi:hypothetical protein